MTDVDSAVVTRLGAAQLADSLAHLVEYPAGSGRLYHRRDDGSVLRVETLLADNTWFDLTCDVVEASIQWGDVSGNDLTPTSAAGQALIQLRDADGRYGPIPPAGSTLFQRWRPVRIWLGYLDADSVVMADDTTHFGEPGAFGSTPPEFYGGYPREVRLNGIRCRFSGWLMSQERNPMADVVTNWSCGDGIVRLVDQKVPDYDAAPSDDMPDGLRDASPGNYRVSALVAECHGPDGNHFETEILPTPSRRMMQSPDGTALSLIQKVAEADLSFFWWQPDVPPFDHTRRGDRFIYRSLDWFRSHGLVWPLDCDHTPLTSLDIVSDDKNFYTAVRAAKGITKRTVLLPQPPWVGAAFDNAPRQVAYRQWRVQPGEHYSIRVQMNLSSDKVNLEFWVRFPALGDGWTKVSNSTLSHDDTKSLDATSGGSTVVVETTADDALMEVLVKGVPQGYLNMPSVVADDVVLIIARSAGGGDAPEVVVDDPALADEAEVHEYERNDLMLRYQSDVDPWAQWIVRRSKTRRYTLTNAATTPARGAPLWSWGMWHSADLGDQCAVEILDGDFRTDQEWIRGLEFRVAPDALTLTLHLEQLPDPTFANYGLRATGATPRSSVYPDPGIIPFPGGHLIPAYDVPPELPGRSTPADAGKHLRVDNTGELVWSTGEDIYPIRTDDPPGERFEIQRQPGGNPAEIRWYSGGPSVDFSAYDNVEGPDYYTSRFIGDGYSTDLQTMTYRDPYGGSFFGETHLEPGYGYTEVDANNDRGGTEAYSEHSAYASHSTGPPEQFTGTADWYGWVAGFETAQASVELIYGNYADVGQRPYWQADPFDPTEIAASLYAMSDGRGPGGDPFPEWPARAVRELFITPDLFGVRAEDVDVEFSSPPAVVPVGCMEMLIGARVADPAMEPSRHQYARQIGREAVTFTAGVGTITTPKPMGANRFPLAQVVGATVGGPMVAQLDSPTTTTVTLALSTAFTGSLTVAWQVEHDAVFPYAPKWINTYDQYAGHTLGMTNCVPYAVGGSSTMSLYNVRRHYSIALEVRDRSGAVVGECTPGPLNYETWTVAADLHPPGTGAWLHLHFPGGEEPDSTELLVTWKVRPATAVALQAEQERRYRAFGAGGPRQRQERTRRARHTR